MELKVTVSQKGAIFEGKAPERIGRAIYSAMVKATSLLEGEVKKRTPVGVFGAQGGLKGSIQGEVEPKGIPVMKGTPVIKGIVFTKSEYAEVVEKGRRPGKMPPQGALRRWIEVNDIHMKDVGSIQEGLAISHYKKRRRIRSIQEALIISRERKQLEFLIRRKIGREGTKGAHMFENALDENWSKIQKIFDDAGFEIAKSLNE